MIKLIKALLKRKVVKIQPDQGLSVVEYDPDKHYFVIVNERHVNIDDILLATNRPDRLGSITIVRVDK